MSGNTARVRPGKGAGWWKAILARAAAYAFLLLIAAVALFPFYTMLISSTHDNYNIMTQVNILPGGQFLRNYNRLTENLSIWRGFANSALIATASVALGVYFTALTGYTFAKFRFKGRDLLYGVVLVAMMIPTQIAIVGLFKEMSDLKLLNSYWPLVLPSISNCFGVFFFKQYLDGSLPDAMLEAAFMDGCGEITTYHRLVLPTMTPALVTQGVLTFIGSWNNYLNPMILIRETSRQTLPVLIATVKSNNATDYGAQYVGILISVIPLVILFSLASRVIMDKISIGSAVKG